MHGSCLTISIVTFNTDLEQFAQVLRQLAVAVDVLQRQAGCNVHVTMVENGNDASALQAFIDNLQTGLAVRVVSTGRNLGYGKAQNVAVRDTAAEFHLIMNPDVLLDANALLQGISFLRRNPAVAAISPEAVDGSGNRLYLCKQYPSLFNLLLRGFAPGAIRLRFAGRLAIYENRAMVDSETTAEVDLISGCFMLCRTAMLKQTGGFNEAFFLYFEDFALSIELRKFGSLMYVPAVKIVHFGGDASRKGLRHIGYFAASAAKFYQRYGWKFL